MKAWIAGLALMSALKAQAAIVQASLLVGKPLVFMDLNTRERASLGAVASVAIEASIFSQDYPFAMGLFYETYLKSDFGAFPLNSAGLQASYYPFGKPSTSSNVEGVVSMRRTGLTVYGTAGGGLTFFNIRGSEPGVAFGASGFNLRMAGNMDYPLSESFMVGANFLYQTTFGAMDADSPSNPVGMTGWAINLRTSYLFH